MVLTRMAHQAGSRNARDGAEKLRRFAKCYGHFGKQLGGFSRAFNLELLYDLAAPQQPLKGTCPRKEMCPTKSGARMFTAAALFT